jgi:outer membrane protein
MHAAWQISRKTQRIRGRRPAPWLAFALIASAVGPAVVRAETIDDSMNWALRSSFSVQADNQRQVATEARLRGSIDAFMPTVSWVQEQVLSSHISYTPDFTIPDSNGLDTVARREPNLSGIQASLPLFDGFRRYNNYRAARLGVDAGRYLQLDKRQQTYLDAATAYLAIVRDRKIVAFRKQQVAGIAQIAERTKVRLSMQEATLTDVDIARSRLIAAQGAVDQTAADLQADEIEYTRITGNRPGDMPEPRVPNDCVPASVEQLTQALVANNPKLLAARLGAVAAGYDADANANAKFGDVLPQINLVASSIEQSDISAALNKFRDNTVKVQMRVPIYEPGAFPRIHEAAALARQKSWETADSQKQDIASATSLYARHQSTIALIGRASARVKTMQRAVDGYRIERAAGFRTVVDILNAQNELTEAELARVTLEFTRDTQVFSIAALLARLGPGSAQATPQIAPQMSLLR